MTTTDEKQLVSIITPAFNCEKFFLDAFNSVVGQTYTYFEWIIVDDCSVDGSFDYIKSLSKNDSRIIVFQTEKNSGTAVARNLALRHIKGRYVVFLDSDDLWDPCFLEEQIAFIKENGPLVTSGYRRVTPNSTSDFIPPSEVCYKHLLNGNPLSCLTTMYDRQVIGEQFFPEDLLKCEDYAFWLNICKSGVVARGNPKVLATYRIHAASKSYNKFKLIKYMYAVYHKSQKLNFFSSVYHIVRWAFYGIKKYRNVK